MEKDQNNRTVFESEQTPHPDVSIGHQEPKVGERSKGINISEITKNVGIKLKDPKVRLSVIAGAIVVVIIAILTVILIIISVLSPRNSIVQPNTNSQNAQTPVVSDPKAKEQQRLNEEVQNFDLEERPLLPPEVEFDLEF